MYPPDPASLGQHLADVTRSLAGRGHRVIVLTSNRGYENPKNRYVSSEVRDGVAVRRLPFSSLGKSSLPMRLIGAALFLAQCLAIGLTARRVDGILVSTSPPMCGVLALLIGYIRRIPYIFWLMDLNPDQAIVLGKVAPSSPLARVYARANRWVFRRAAALIVLDRFMADRLKERYSIERTVDIIPPWPHDDVLEDVRCELNPFIDDHRLAGKFVVMYSGNHSPASPLNTLVQAALNLKEHSTLHFAFIGGGAEKANIDRIVREQNPPNILSLPYQPLEILKYSLSAADVHVVTLGDNMPGIIHPCKVYGAMSVRRPILYIGPVNSHVSDLLATEEIGWQVNHGDVDGLASLLRRIAEMPSSTLFEMGQNAGCLVRRELSMSLLCGQVVEVVERVINQGE